MINWYKKVVFENYANFNGRARRSEYWYFVLMNMIISFTLIAIDELLKIKMLNYVYGLIVFIPGLAVAVRRLHDVGKSGWWLLIFYMIIGCSAVGSVIGGMSSFMSVEGSFLGSSSLTVFFVSLFVLLASAIWFLVLFCKAGDEGANKYGADPKGFGEELNEIGLE